MFGSRKTEVLIAGAGPVGLFTAVSLLERDVQVELFDSDRRKGTRSYALALHPHTLQLLQGVGLADRLAASGLRIDRVCFYDLEGERAAIDLGRLRGGFPYVLVVPQNELESVLQEYLREKKVKIHWDHRLQNIRRDGGKVKASIAQLDRVTLGYPVALNESVITKVFDVEADYVIGADGYHSRVRNILGSEFKTYGDPVTFFVTEFDADGPIDPEIRVVMNKTSTNVLWPMSAIRARWSFQISEDQKKNLTEESLDQLLRARAPWFTRRPAMVHWASQVTFDQRLSTLQGKDRTWLVGDSAHITGPVGVQSMNIGMREADDLAARLGKILRSSLSDQTLKNYSTERESEWRMLLEPENSVRVDSSCDDWLQKRAVRIVPCVPAGGEDLQAVLSQIGIALG